MSALSEDQKKQLAKLDRLEEKERRARYRRLTYSPGEKVWLWIALASWIGIWVFLV